MVSSKEQYNFPQRSNDFYIGAIISPKEQWLPQRSNDFLKGAVIFPKEQWFPPTWAQGLSWRRNHFLKGAMYSSKDGFPKGGMDSQKEQWFPQWSNDYPIKTNCLLKKFSVFILCLCNELYISNGFRVVMTLYTAVIVRYWRSLLIRHDNPPKYLHMQS